MTKYNPARDIPEFARELKTTSPTRIVQMILNRRNVQRTPESITWWFKAHPDIYDQLTKEFREGLPTEKQAVDQTIFQNSSFEEIPSVKNWILEMNARELAQGTMRSQLATLRTACQGTFSAHNIDLVQDGKWCLKHPDRLTLNDAVELISLLKAKGIDTYHYKRSLKDFLISKGVVVGKKIAVGRSKSYGKYANLHVEPEKVSEILEEVRKASFEAYAADLFMLKTATRVSATLNAKIEDINHTKTHITVFDKGRRTKYAKGHPWDKRLDLELLSVLDQVIGDRKSGEIFTIKADALAQFNKEAIQKVASEVLERYPDLMPNHFWRHMFAQIMLVQTDWNYGIVAALGGWTPQALEESYGKPPEQLVKQWSDKYQLNVEVATVEAVSA